MKKFFLPGGPDARKTAPALARDAEMSVAARHKEEILGKLRMTA
jgi:hypothetical protein